MNSFSISVQIEELEPQITEEEIQEVLKEIYEEDSLGQAEI